MLCPTCVAMVWDREHVCARAPLGMMDAACEGLGFRVCVCVCVCVCVA